MDYYGKHFKQVSKDYYSLLISDKQILQLHLLLGFCIEDSRLESTKNAKYLCRELRQELADILVLRGL